MQMTREYIMQQKEEFKATQHLKYSVGIQKYEMCQWSIEANRYVLVRKLKPYTSI